VAMIRPVGIIRVLCTPSFESLTTTGFAHKVRF
jgi:hypothetical protein